MRLANVYQCAAKVGITPEVEKCDARPEMRASAGTGAQQARHIMSASTEVGLGSRQVNLQAREA